jgi:hypothetical protein
VQTSAGPVAERTPFERLTIEPDEGGYDEWDYGNGYYWGDPYWVNPEFAFGVYPVGFGGGVVIHRGPHFGHGFHRGGFHGGGGHGGGFHGGGGGHR